MVFLHVSWMLGSGGLQEGTVRVDANVLQTHSANIDQHDLICWPCVDQTSHIVLGYNAVPLGCYTFAMNGESSKEVVGVGNAMETFHPSDLLACVSHS